MKYFFLIIYFFFIYNITFLQSKETNYQKLKKIEEKLLIQQEIYLELIKIEQNIRKNINKTNTNLKKYKKLIRKGYSEKKFIEQAIQKKKKLLIEIITLKDALKDNQSLLLNNIIISKLNNSYSEEKDIILKVILENTYSLYTDYIVDYLALKTEVENYEIMLTKLNGSLNNIELSLKNRSSDLEGLIAETIITKIEKHKNILKKNKTKKKANKIKSLIEDFENNNLENKLFGNFKFKKLRDILPIEKINIKEIKKEKLNTGVKLSVLNETKLVAPKNSLVVYADLFKGYGNMIILDLSNGYHLILSGLSSIKCNTGDWLEKGMILGDINSSNNNNFYMEFRLNGKTISPTKWAKLN